MTDRVAWVHGADTELGHDVALRLAAAGLWVLVTGAAERALGACVGEIAHGGGKARHLVGGVGSDEAVAGCVAAATERFGRVDVAVVVGSADDAARVERVAKVPAVAAAASSDPVEVADQALGAVNGRR
jgi:NAD(P)-dependent dehydrogenase (short-subunit alcohol dehydrogenase family)